MRTLPTFGKRIPGSDLEDLVRLIAIVVLVYFEIDTISHVISGHGSKLDYFTCFATPICLIIFYVWYSRKKTRENKKIQEERGQWLKACKSVEVSIVNRHHSAGGTFEDGYYPGEYHHHSPSYSVQLAMTDDQRKIASNQTVVNVNVNSDTYEKLEKRDTVRIYYKPEKPFTFLLEEEV